MGVIPSDSNTWPGRRVGEHYLRNLPLHILPVSEETAQEVWSHLPADYAEFQIYLSYAGLDDETGEKRYYLRISDTVFFRGVAKNRVSEIRAFIRGYLACLRAESKEREGAE